MCFEDEFMEKQADLVGHTLEFYKNDVDKLYIWIESRQKSYSFNVFALKNNKIIPKEDMNREDFTVYDFLGEAVYFIRNEFKKLSEKYNMLLPSEIKIVFDVHTNNFDAKYKYDKEGEEPMSDYEIMEIWEKEVRNTLV